MTGIRVRRLRLRGATRDYNVSFLDTQGRPRALAIVAGQILTGKTSILEFIAYCLGDSDFPRHPEIRRSVRSALLECELQGIPYVIERGAVDTASGTAVVHSCDLEGLAGAHQQAEYNVAPPGDPESFSQFLLEHFGLANVVLREAPTQPGSKVDRLSIRDLLRLMFIQHRMLDNQNLLLESNPPVVRLKHEQVLDLIFHVHDNTAASMAAEIQAVDGEIERQQQRLDTILAFLLEQEVPDDKRIAEERAQIDRAEADTQVHLRSAETRMEAEASFGDQLRAAHQTAASAARRAANDLRNIRTQIERLMALAGQYDDDIKKLTFAKEASRLFDPLSIRVCPWCLQAVTPQQDKGESECQLCHQPLLVDNEQKLDIDKDLRAIRARRRELATYISELDQSATDRERALREARADEQRNQTLLDAAVASRFSPYIVERDALLGAQANAISRRNELAKYSAMSDAAERRRRELGRLRQQSGELRAAQVAAMTKGSTRDAVVAALSTRFGEVLHSFHFPKLSNPVLDKRFVPYVRETRYDRVGSAGATTLISLAWYLSVFEESAESGGAHPGLLMVDSPQKNLLPATGQQADDYQGAVIAQSVYRHMLAWSKGPGGSHQIIVVDNEPPPFVETAVVVRFSGDPNRPPFGLIEDATD
jgi:hypothetical protein